MGLCPQKGEQGVKQQFGKLEYSLEIQGKYQELVQKLSSLNGQVTSEERHTLYNACLTRAKDLNACQVSELAILLREKLGITTTDFREDLKKAERTLKKIEREGSKEKPNYLNGNKKDAGNHRRAQSLVDGRLCYRTKRGWVVAGQPDVEEAETGCPLYHFSTKGHIRYLNSERPKIGIVYDAIMDKLMRHVVWKNPHYPVAVTLWIMGTYFANIFAWYGYLWITSPARRCGKSLLLELISHLAYNSTDILTNPSPAYLYRTVDVDFPTVIIDELSKFKGDGGDDYSKVLSLLNAGAKKGSVVARMEKIKETYEARYYHAYCPKTLAGLVALPDTLADRSLKIDMARKKKGERVERLNLRKQSPELEALRDDLYLIGLSYDHDVAEFYDRAGELDIPAEVDDRLRDILEPLFAVAGVLGAEKGNLHTTAALQTYALELAGARSADDHADSAQHAIRALLKLNLKPEGAESEMVFTSKEALNLFSQEPELGWCDNSWKAGRLTNGLGFVSKSHRIGARIIRGYKLNYQDLHDLKERYLGNTEIV